MYLVSRSRSTSSMTCRPSVLGLGGGCALKSMVKRLLRAFSRERYERSESES